MPLIIEVDKKLKSSEEDSIRVKIDNCWSIYYHYPKYFCYTWSEFIFNKSWQEIKIGLTDNDIIRIGAKIYYNNFIWYGKNLQDVLRNKRISNAKIL